MKFLFKCYDFKLIYIVKNKILINHKVRIIVDKPNPVLIYKSKCSELSFKLHNGRY